jgi:hypothetical protein
MAKLMARIPNGWSPPDGTTASIEYFDCVLLGNGARWVTVDMNARRFGFGTVRPRPNGDQFIFRGRGWQKKILNAACEFLNRDAKP